MKGLILSGGHGVRLRPLTHSQQKQLIPIANKPILFYVIEDLIDSGINDIAIIVGPNKEQIIETVSSVKWNARISYIYQDAPRGLAHAVKIAKDFTGNENFVMYLGDNLLKEGSKEFVEDFVISNVDASILLTEVEDPTQYGVALVDEQNKVIVKLLEKPKNPPTNLSIVGIYGLTPKIYDAIENITPSWRGELEITDALHWLIEQNYTVRYKRVTGWWKDTGMPEDIIDANRLVLDTIKTNIKGEITDSTRSGEIIIGENSIIKGNSKLYGPLIIGKNCTVNNSIIGPYTSIGNNSTIENTNVEDSIVMENAKITDINKISKSLIGKSVSINNNKISNEISLMIGDNSRVII